MPGDYRNSLGFLNLQLRAAQLQQDQQRQAQIEQYGREAQQQDTANALAFMKQHEAATSAHEDRKLQLAAMLQKASEDRALREQIAGQSDTTKRRGQDLTNEDRDLSREIQKGGLTLNQGKFEYQKSHDKVEDSQRAYGLFSGRIGAVNPPNPVTGDRPFQLGSELLSPPPGAGGLSESAPSAQPTTSGPAPGVTPTPPNAPDETGMTRKQREDALEKASTDAQAIKDLREVVDALHDPKQADPSDFGNTGGRFSIHGVTPNTIGDILGTAGSARRTSLNQKISVPLNNFMRKYGAALTETELGRALGEAGLQRAINGQFDVFAAPLPIAQSSFKATLDRLEESAGRTNEELRTNKRKLPDVRPQTTRREPAAKTVDIDFSDKARREALFQQYLQRLGDPEKAADAVNRDLGDPH